MNQACPIKAINYSSFVAQFSHIYKLSAADFDGLASKYPLLTVAVYKIQFMFEWALDRISLDYGPRSLFNRSLCCSGQSQSNLSPLSFHLMNSHASLWLTVLQLTLTRALYPKIGDTVSNVVQAGF